MRYSVWCIENTIGLFANRFIFKRSVSLYTSDLGGHFHVPPINFFLFCSNGKITVLCPPRSLSLSRKQAVNLSQFKKNTHCIQRVYIRTSYSYIYINLHDIYCGLNIIPSHNFFFRPKNLSYSHILSVSHSRFYAINEYSTHFKYTRQRLRVFFFSSNREGERDDGLCN